MINEIMWTPIEFDELVEKREDGSFYTTNVDVTFDSEKKYKQLLKGGGEEEQRLIQKAKDIGWSTELGVLDMEVVDWRNIVEATKFSAYKYVFGIDLTLEFIFHPRYLKGTFIKIRKE